ncbi:MAG: hypothetical protein U5K38_00800 [Woeseiaceae bacterium]|nr:hypothetical protein [Woeseiaceae bacterium]
MRLRRLNGCCPVVAVDHRSSEADAHYVGRNLTADGSVLLGGTGEEPSSHWLEIVPRRSHAPGSQITVGATEQARLPARLSTIPQSAETLRYITMNYSSYAGFPAPLTNGGLNEHQVAVRDVRLSFARRTGRHDSAGPDRPQLQ